MFVPAGSGPPRLTEHAHEGRSFAVAQIGGHGPDMVSGPLIFILVLTIAAAC
jgi:hypothetical protein